MYVNLTYCTPIREVLISLYRLPWNSHKLETFCTLPDTKSAKKYGKYVEKLQIKKGCYRADLHETQVVRQLFVQNTYTKFCENLTHGLVAGIT